jgi:hypothetical protein
MRREGEYWMICYDGVTCRLRDARGMRHLHMLLTRPQEDISALVLEREGRNLDDVDETDPTEVHDSRERARVNVTRALGLVLKRIAEHHPALREHLAATLRTGTFCRYMPDPLVPSH